MDVCVDKPGHDCPAIQLDGARLGPAQGVQIVAQCLDAPVFDGQRRRTRLDRVEGVDAAAPQDQVGRHRVHRICDDRQRVPAATVRPLLIIDGDNLAHRAYHSMPKTLKSTDGRPINAFIGWTNMVVYLWELEQPRSIFVAWDTLTVPTYRHELWPTYQAGRVFDRALLQQLDLLPGIAAAFGFGVGKGAGYE